MKARIGIDARLYTQTGVGRYIKNLVSELSFIQDEYEYYIYLLDEEYGVFNPPDSRFIKRLLNVRWHTASEQVIVPKVLINDRIDLAHFPYFNVPVLYNGKYLLTVHDLIIDHFDTGRASTLPYPLYKAKRKAYSYAIKKGILGANHITTISDTTKRELIDHYHISEEKITVTYDALDETFRKKADKYKNEKPFYNFPYILYVGNAYPHKNLELFLEAFKVVCHTNEIKLVLAGNDSFFYPRLERYAKQIGIYDKCMFFGIANDLELVNLYKNAKFLVFPSLMEGFGLPPFESLYVGTLPVLSNIPVFREIWENDLIYFDPSQKDDMVKCLVSTLKMKKEDYQKKVEKAKKRIDKFSFKRSAERTHQIYRKILHSK